LNKFEQFVKCLFLVKTFHFVSIVSAILISVLYFSSQKIAWM